MAILTALLAPQLLRYVEQSREAKDATTMDEVTRACYLALTANGITGNGICWYTSEGELIYVNQQLAKDIALTLGGTAKKDPNTAYWKIEGLPLLISKKCMTSTSSTSYPVPLGRQVINFTQRKDATGVVVDTIVE